VFDPTTEDVSARIRERTTVGVDVAIECVGNENSLAACLQSVRRQGSVVQVGLATSPCKVDLQLLVIKNVTLRGSFCYPIYFVAACDRFNCRWEITVEKAVSSRVTLDSAVSQGFEVLTAPGTDRIKILIQMAA
jgi:(R,R)-butanediol dehydrogenase / meso-butanediol dehydrogenase / diacetyl reductase